MEGSPKMKEKLLSLGQKVINPKKPLHTILPIVLCVVLVASIILIANSISELVIKDPIFRFDTGAKIEYTGRTAIKVDSETGEISVKNSGISEIIDSSPIYFSEDPGRLLQPKQVVVVFPKTKSHGKSGLNMQIRKDGEKVIAKVRARDVDISNAFLYDGENTYLFIEPVTIALGLDEIKLPAYSYISVYYNLRVEIYSPDESVNRVIPIMDTPVMAISNDLSYQIDLSKDILHTPEGDILLITDPSVLNYVNEKSGKR